MIHVREAIVVEGRYDKGKLASCVDALVVETNGFGIFRDKEKLAYLRRLADTRGLLILTDSDGAGNVIRSYLKSAIPPEKLRQAYIPELFGKERRKDHPSKAGTLGVEGMSADVIAEAIRRSGATVGDAPAEKPVTKAELYALGLSGAPDSAEKRRKLCLALGLPGNLTSGALCGAIGSACTREEFDRAAQRLSDGR